MEKDKQRIWYVIFYILILVLLFRYFPKAGYGVAAITLLVLLFQLRKRKQV